MYILCTKCNKLKNETEYYKYNDKIVTPCKHCKKKYSKKYYNEHIDYRREYDKAYGDAHREERNAKQKQYYKNNIDKVKAYDKIRNKRDALTRSFSSNIRISLKGNKAGRHWETLVPYTLADLRQHLESQFTPEMNWGNYGTYWEVDHIIPQNTFNITSAECDDFQACWSLNNLRPLEKSTNRSRPKDGSDIPIFFRKELFNNICKSDI